MKLGIIRHALSQPFVAATAIAALIHSTWSLCVFMGGEQPLDTLHLIGWLLPGFLLAFSLDIGLLWTAGSIHRHEGGKGMYAAMFTLLLAMFYLQWLYMVTHAPLISLGAGVRADWIPAIETGRDLSVFVIPALLPLSVAMYTFSRREEAGSQGTVAEPFFDTSGGVHQGVSEKGLVAAPHAGPAELPAEVLPDAAAPLMIAEPEQEESPHTSGQIMPTGEKIQAAFLRGRANGNH